MTGEIKQIKFNAVYIQSFINYYCDTFSNLISSVIIPLGYDKNILILASYYKTSPDRITDIKTNETAKTTNLDEIIASIKTKPKVVSSLMSLT